MRRAKTIFYTGYLSVAILLQLMIGNFPFRFFAYPVNIFIALLWLFALWIWYKDYPRKPVVRFLLSSSMTVFTLVAFIVGCMIIGLFPQLSVEEAASKDNLWGRLGCYDFMTSWIFVSVLFLLLTHLALVTFHGALARRKYRWRFVANHAGLWLALFAGFFGASDYQNLRIPVLKGEASSRAYSMEGKVVYLDYELELLSFDADYYENGMPRHYEAEVRVGKDTACLEVNHPYSYRWGEDIYLTGYERKNGQTAYCVLQIVRQPWKYVQLAGILLTLIGGVLLFIEGPVNKKKLQK